MIFYRNLDELTAAAEAGDANAQYELAMGHITGFCKGQAVEVSSIHAYNWMMLAAEQVELSQPNDARVASGAASPQGYVRCSVPPAAAKFHSASVGSRPPSQMQNANASYQVT